MGNYVPRPAPQAKTKPLSEEEKQMQVMRFLQQKREQFSLNILCNMVQGAITNRDATNFECTSLVDLSVEMADKLIEKLYPLPEETDKSNK